MSGRKVHNFRSMALLSLLVWVAACADSKISDVDAQLSTVEFSPNSLALDAGQSTSVSAFVVDRSGRRVAADAPNFSVNWSSSDPTVLSVSGSGSTATVTALSGGTAQLSAEVYLQSKPQPIRRNMSVLSRPAVASIRIGGGNNQTGPVSVVLPQKLAVQTLNVDGTGVRGAVVRFAVKLGNGNVSATEVLTDETGTAAVNWTLGPVAGSNRVEATVQGFSPLVFEATGTVAASHVQISEGDGQQGIAGQPLSAPLGVRVLDATLKPLSGVSVAWTAVTGGGQITTSSLTDATGVARATWVLGTGTGTQSARASVGSLSAQFTATAVTNLPDQIVKIGGDGQTALVSTALPDSLKVRVVDGQGNPKSGVAVRWAVTGGGGAVSPGESITDATGVARASWQLGSTAGVGTASATATNVGSVSFSATAQSASSPPPPPPAVASLTLTPQSVTLNALGAQTSLVATTYDVNGQVVTGQTITWTTSNSMIATVDNAGRVTAKAVGTALIVASALCCNKADTTAVTVTQQLASVAVLPKTASVVVGASTQLSAAGKDANGYVIPTATISWSSANSAVASVSASGVVTGAGAGSAIIRASSGTFRDSAVVTVTSASAPAPTPVLTTISLTPTSASLLVGATQTFTAVAKDQNGNVMSGVTFNWTSSNSSVMTVSQGVVTAIAVGVATLNASSGSVTASASVSVTAPSSPPPPSGSFSPPDIAFADMENGTTSPFTTATGGTTGNADIVIMNDPTGAFGGKVARMRFARQSTAASADVNRSLRYTHTTGVGLGQTVFMRGHVYVPTPAANMLGAQRKLFYVQRQQNDISFVFLKAESSITGGQHLKVELTRNKVFNVGDLPFNKKVSIEMQITTNSAVGVSDGIIRIWIDGVLKLDKSGIEWLTSTAPFKVFLFGQQTQHLFNDLSVLFDEYRYWDNMALSTKRIGP